MENTKHGTVDSCSESSGTFLVSRFSKKPTPSLEHQAYQLPGFVTRVRVLDVIKRVYLFELHVVVEGVLQGDVPKAFLPDEIEAHPVGRRQLLCAVVR